MTSLTLSVREEKLITEIERLPLRDFPGKSTAGMILPEKLQDYQNLYFDMLIARSDASGRYKEQANKMNTLWNLTSGDRVTLIMKCQGDCPIKSLVKVICLELQNGEGARGLSLLWNCIENAQEDQCLLDISKLSAGRSKLLESFSKYIGVEKVWAKVMWPNSIPTPTPLAAPALLTRPAPLVPLQKKEELTEHFRAVLEAEQALRSSQTSCSSMPAMRLEPTIFSPPEEVPASCLGELRQRK
jgi:hypothetical protein